MKYNRETRDFDEITPDDAIAMRRLALTIMEDGQIPELPEWAEDFIEHAGVTANARTNRILIVSTALVPKILATLVTMHSEQWTRYHAGSWQRRGVETLPEPGRYDTCTADREPCLTPIVTYRDPKTQEMTTPHSWGGYIWNQPLPEPVPPEEP